MTSEIKYKEVNGTFYHEETNKAVIDALEFARSEKIRLRIYLGDTATGKVWNEEHDIFGYIGRSTGNIKIPLLIASKRSYGGGAILDHSIIKIKESKGKNILYQHPNFTPSVIEVREAREQEKLLNYTHTLYIDGKMYSNHKSLKSAELLKKRLS
jgi:hypothetical protein